MNKTRFDNILSSHSSVAQKIFNLIPVDKSWSLDTIYFEVRRKNLTTANRSVVERCLRELEDSGLLKEAPKNTFTRTTPHRVVAQVIKREPMVHQRQAQPAEPPKAPMASLPTTAVAQPPAQPMADPAPAVEQAKTAVVVQEAPPVKADSPATAAAVVLQQMESTKDEAAPATEALPVEDYALAMPIAYHERYMELRLEHGVTMLRELALLVDSPVSQTMFELAEDFNRLKKLVRRVPALERQPEPVNELEQVRMASKPDDQTELREALGIKSVSEEKIPLVALSKVKGGSNSAEYRCWSNIRFNKTVEVEPNWRNSFDKFVADVGFRPDPQARLLRTDKSKGFVRGNVQWKIGDRVIAFNYDRPVGWPVKSH